MTHNVKKMDKINSAFIINQYRSGVDSYVEITKEVGLWASEAYVFKKYLLKSNKILDLGCGTGRTTFPLYDMGYRDIVGLDLTPEMIEKAKGLNVHFGTTIDFVVGDARKMTFSESIFDAVVFSFNGLMSIPSQAYRDKALKEISRVLKNDGIFIFTTHDRNKEEAYRDFWKKEKGKWINANQNPALFEFGDLIAKSKNESSEIFIHIPTETEIRNWLNAKEFVVMETFYRDEKFTENEKVRLKSGGCRFWVARNER